MAEKFIINRIQISSSLMLLSIFCLFFSYLPLRAQNIVPAGLGPMSATQPNRETAILTGNLLRNGGQNPTVKIVWGYENAGAKPAKSFLLGQRLDHFLQSGSGQLLHHRHPASWCLGYDRHRGHHCSQWAERNQTGRGPFLHRRDSPLLKYPPSRLA